MEHEQPCTHTHTRTIYIYFSKWQNHLVLLSAQNQDHFSQFGKVAFAQVGWATQQRDLGESSTRIPAKVQDIEDAFRLSDLPFH